MTPTRIELLEAAFLSPAKHLGTVERNTENKIVYLALWELGWDPVQDIALGFQIPKDKIGQGAEAAHAVDFALRDHRGLCAIGEAKQWFIDDKEWAAAATQVRRYQTALPVRAFLSSGRRWIICDEGGKELARIEETHAAALIEQIKPYLGKGSITNALTDQSIWDYGICPSGKAKDR